MNLSELADLSMTPLYLGSIQVQCPDCTTLNDEVSIGVTVIGSTAGDLSDLRMVSVIEMDACHCQFVDRYGSWCAAAVQITSDRRVMSLMMMQHLVNVHCVHRDA